MEYRKSRPVLSNVGLPPGCQRTGRVYDVRQAPRWTGVPVRKRIVRDAELVYAPRQLSSGATYYYDAGETEDVPYDIISPPKRRRVHRPIDSVDEGISLPLSRARVEAFSPEVRTSSYNPIDALAEAANTASKASTLDWDSHERAPASSGPREPKKVFEEQKEKLKGNNAGLNNISVLAAAADSASRTAEPNSSPIPPPPEQKKESQKEETSGDVSAPNNISAEPVPPAAVPAAANPTSPNMVASGPASAAKIPELEAKSSGTKKGKRPVCKECGKSYATTGTLNRHMRIHRDERPFMCLSCPSRFRQRSHLIAHLKVHRKQKNLCCEVCGKYFSQKTALNSHQRDEHPEFYAYQLAYPYLDRRYQDQARLPRDLPPRDLPHRDISLRDLPPREYEVRRGW
eukprot:CAMPEP_0184487244 /NCGR_PEP_ID=MMETSP0113_2-20130426/9553_1 /TAXON_ID=91329 /ORGANISM="Norrisiella sphaerica, Strain BC52" /LENGTH=400 /DNA_ID=CAMNT_0026869461 /DNA_START=364 /DNA_END=1563 /DNA_ORIENTATION=+